MMIYTFSTLLFCTSTHIVYSCILVYISLSWILGHIRSSTVLSPVVHCYAALSHTWLDCPLVLSFQPPTPLFSLLFCFYFLSATFSFPSLHLRGQQYACILHFYMLISTLPSLSDCLLPHLHLYAVALVPEEALPAGSSGRWT